MQIETVEEGYNGFGWRFKHLFISDLERSSFQLLEVPSDYKGSAVYMYLQRLMQQDRKYLGNYAA